MSLKKFVFLRFLYAIPTVLILLTAVFFLTHVIPGDPARAIVGPDAPEEVVAAIRHKIGLDKPILDQYFDYIGGVLRGDLGMSISGVYLKTLDVSSWIRSRMPATIEIAFFAWVITFIVGIVTGSFSALNEGKVVDHLFRVSFLFFYSVPVYVIAILFQLVFAVYLGVFPVYGTFSEAFRIEPITGFRLIDNLLVGSIGGFFDGLAHLFLPSLALALYYSGIVSRISRGEMIKAMNRMYCLLAEAKGLKRITIGFRHALRNAFLPIFTITSLQAVSLLCGSIWIETVFSIDGLASLFVRAAGLRDYMVMQGCVTVFALVAVMLGIITDIVYYLIDPRIRY